MNILEAYIKKYKQFIVLLLGYPCSNKSEIAKELVEDLHLPIININDYLKPDVFVQKTISNIKFKLYEHPDNYDWDKLNNDVNSIKSNGLILYGNFIDKNKIDFKIDFCYFFSINTNLCKKILIEKKLIHYNENDKRVKVFFFNIFEPLYKQLKNDIKINKFFNVKENTTFDEIYDEVFDNLMELIKKF